LELLQENPDKINWFTLSYNTNIKTAELICKFPDKIVWNNLLMVSDPHNFMKISATGTTPNSLQIPTLST
jgi:hypothetical protein